MIMVIIKALPNIEIDQDLVIDITNLGIVKEVDQINVITQGVNLEESQEVST